ncbi:putative LRR receptor-like serine/threonine-protein kinase [Acorus gramineus]|uniref:LRR receptor-like serine/threonine-protein kinase n=1 Tax=Acorus gramineus TaxID=55184 RepID=A0AAV9A6J5_ACOGR|nr:putative LRR receptor-like serine/threonine-protein kinase [Acorus gramineus]
MPRNSRTASLLLLHLLLLLLTASSAQLSPSDVRTLLRLRLILENPPAFDTLTRFTNPCYLPPSPSLHITCLGNRVSELSILGSPDHHRPLSPNFSIDSLFTTLTRLQGLRSLSLVSLGIWGPLPPKIDRFSSLISLNLSSNYISGEIPHQISQLRSLQNLILAKNSINGSVPNLEAMSNLVEVDLGHNRLGPGFPSLPNTVISVSLKNNSIRSRVPSKVDGFDELRSLDVSYNRLVGPVPPFLFSLKSIEYLVLSNNRLSGTFLKNLSCNEELEFVDVSSNLLYGGLPMCIGSNSTGRVVLDSGNCLSSGDQRYQNPMKECQEEALAAVMMPKEVNKKESKNRLGLVLGVVGGSVVALGVVLCLIFWWVKKKRNVEAGLQGSGGAKVSMRVTQKIPADARHMSQAMRLGSMGLTSYRSFSLEEVEDATNNFDASNLIGAGFKGQLHKGWLPDGTAVVVRRLKLKQRESYQRLAQYMEVISKLRHRHLVSILGHCFVNSQIVPNTTDTIYVIFECVSNGTLRDHLKEWRLKEMMKWPQRVAAVIGIARGIQFLHSVMVPGIYRNGLRTENVLLDETLTAKVGSYNLLLPSLINNNGGSERHDAAVNDKFGRAENGDKGDIYHLGLILLEVITGKPVASHGDLETLKVKMQQSLADGHAKLRTVTDTTIRGTFVYDSLRTAVEIALNCVSENVDKRPSIEDVLWNLQYSVQLQEGWASMIDQIQSRDLSVTEPYQVIRRLIRHNGTQHQLDPKMQQEINQLTHQVEKGFIIIHP